MKLYEISKEYENILSESVDENGEISEEYINKLNQIKDVGNNKSIAVASYIKNLDADIIAIDNAINNMKNRRDAIEKQKESMKEYLKFNMERLNISKIKCPYFEIKIAHCPHKVKLDYFNYDINEVLDDKYKITKTKIKINKIMIKNDLIEGKEVKGACLVRDTIVRIK